MTRLDPMSPLRLLLLEDNPADSRLLVESLREQIQAGDISIKLVSRVAQALEALETSRFDCALVDLGLPDSDGVSHVARLRKQSRQMVIIVLTGRADEQA
ncbi:MAG: response regulator, partial [Panacagrimonas sp.]